MTKLFLKSEVQKLSPTRVGVVRSFRAPKTSVFNAFTEPRLLKRWMLGPPGWEMPTCEIDLKLGGKFLWRWKNKSSGAEFGFFGVYQEIITREKIAHTQTYDPGTMGGSMGQPCIVTTTFVTMGEFTNVNTEIEYQSAADLEMALSTGMTGGMEMSYLSLDQLLVSTELKSKE